MVRALKWLVGFLETRFPERVEITKTDLDLLVARIEALNAKATPSEAILERLAKLEIAINAHSQVMGLNAAMGKLGPIGSLER